MDCNPEGDDCLPMAGPIPFNGQCMSWNSIGILYFSYLYHFWLELAPMNQLSWSFPFLSQFEFPPSFYDIVPLPSRSNPRFLDLNGDYTASCSFGDPLQSALAQNATVSPQNFPTEVSPLLNPSSRDSVSDLFHLVFFYKGKNELCY